MFGSDWILVQTQEVALKNESFHAALLLYQDAYFNITAFRVKDMKKQHKSRLL